MTGPLPPMEEMREHLRAAAAREIERREAAPAAPVRRRRRSRSRPRVLVITALSILGLAAAAGATVELISTGEPVPDRRLQSSTNRAVAGFEVDVRAPDPEARVTWGVATYKNAEGQPCAMPGMVRGQAIGRLEKGVFRPYAPNTPGICGDFAKIRLVSDLTVVRAPRLRSLLYGRARPGLDRIELTYQGKPHTGVRGPGGTFLFVFSGEIDPRQVQLTARPAGG
jgi:hypothetical protein